MFRKLRLRTAIYQIVIIVAVLAVVFTVSCVFNYETMNATIDDNLAAVENSSFAKTGAETERSNGLVIKVYSDGRYKLSDSSFYSEETVNKIVSQLKEGKGRVEVDGHFIAYSVKEEDAERYTINVYDYTEIRDSFIITLLIILITGVATSIIVASFIFIFTNKNLAPIEDAFHKQEELVANASHELKTPLTIINTDLAILNGSAEDFTDEQKKWLASIGTQATRMNDMVNEMLLLARFEAVREKNFDKVDLTDIVESVVLETEVLAFERDIEMESDVARDVFVTARQADVEKLVYSLMENAMKYTGEKGKITVTLKAERRKAVLKIRNTGEGIPREVLPKIFTRFYRVDEAHTESGSFGLGLAIAKAIVDSNNGTIGVDSEQGQYTEFIVTLREA